LEDSALGLEDISKTSDPRKPSSHSISLHQPSKTTLSGIQHAVSQTVAERVFDMLKEYRALEPNEKKEIKAVEENQGNFLFDRLVKKCLDT